MTAARGNRATDSAIGSADVQNVDWTYCTVIAGRRAARALAQWTRPFELSDVEFQILWCLRTAGAEGLDQSSLVKRLAYSAAQVSATVEKARARGWICPRSAAGDRRRRLWQLSPSGRGLLDEMLRRASLLGDEATRAGAIADRAARPGPAANAGSPGEAAA